MAAVIFSKYHHPIDQVAVLSEKLSIAPQLKIFPGEFRIGCFRSIGCDGVAYLIVVYVSKKCSRSIYQPSDLLNWRPSRL